MDAVFDGCIKCVNDIKIAFLGVKQVILIEFLRIPRGSTRLNSDNLNYKGISFETHVGTFTCYPTQKSASQAPIARTQAHPSVEASD